MIHSFFVQALFSILRAGGSASPNFNFILVQEVASSGLYTGHVYTIWLPQQEPSDVEIPLRVNGGELDWFYQEEFQQIYPPGLFTIMPGSEGEGNQIASLNTVGGPTFPPKLSKWLFDSFSKPLYAIKTYPASQEDKWVLEKALDNPSLHSLFRKDGDHKEPFSSYGELMISMDSDPKALEEFYNLEQHVLRDIPIKLRLNPYLRFLMANYSMSANIVDFTYPDDMINFLKNQTRPVTLAVSQTFDNPTAASITQKYTASKLMTNVFGYGFTEGTKITTSVSIQAGIPLIEEGSVTIGGEISFNSNQQWTSTSTETYSVETDITVPPFTSVQAMSYVNWVSNMKIPYTATLEIRMKTMRATQAYDMAIVPMELEGLKAYLAQQAPDLKIVGVTEDAVLVKSYGEITGAMGLDTFVVLKNSTSAI